MGSSLGPETALRVLSLDTQALLVATPACGCILGAWLQGLKSVLEEGKDMKETGSTVAGVHYPSSIRQEKGLASIGAQLGTSYLGGAGGA